MVDAAAFYVAQKNKKMLRETSRYSRKESQHETRLGNFHAKVYVLRDLSGDVLDQGRMNAAGEVRKKLWDQLIQVVSRHTETSEDDAFNNAPQASGLLLSSSSSKQTVLTTMTAKTRNEQFYFTGLRRVTLSFVLLPTTRYPYMFRKTLLEIKAIRCTLNFVCSL